LSFRQACAAAIFGEDQTVEALIDNIVEPVINRNRGSEPIESVRRTSVTGGVVGFVAGNSAGDLQLLRVVGGVRNPMPSSPQVQYI
jgi:hypothetical protein